MEKVYGFIVLYKLFNIPPDIKIGHPDLSSIITTIDESASSLDDISQSSSNVINATTYELFVFFKEKSRFPSRYKNIVDVVTTSLASTNSGVAIQFAKQDECRIAKTKKELKRMGEDVQGVREVIEEVSAAATTSNSAVAAVTQDWEGYVMKVVFYVKRFASYFDRFMYDPTTFAGELRTKITYFPEMDNAAIVISIVEDKFYCFTAFIKSTKPTYSNLLELSKHVSEWLYEDECWGSHVVGQGHFKDWKGIGNEWDSRVVSRDTTPGVDWPRVSFAIVPYRYDEYFDRGASVNDRKRLQDVLAPLKAIEAESSVRDIVPASPRSKLERAARLREQLRALENDM
jgi:hypothetical protein